MKFVIMIAIAVLTACGQAPTKTERQLPPLSSVMNKVAVGMGLNDVEKALSGHQPTFKFSENGKIIWEVQERLTNPKTNGMNANQLTVVFNNNGKVGQTSSSLCYLPDREQASGLTPSTKCYQKFLFPFDKQLTYNAIKRLLIISNYQVDHSDAASELISATGSQRVEGDDDQMMFIKLSIVFTPAQNDSTEVVMSASFSISEKQDTWVQIGFAGVQLPVPLPFQHTEEWIETGVVTPRFYLNFYDALNKLIATEYRHYAPPKLSQILAVSKPAAEVKSQQIQRAINPVSTSQTVTPSEDTFLENLSGPIDAVKPPQSKPRSSAIDSDSEDDEEKEDGGLLTNLNGKPIDSSKINR